MNQLTNIIRKPEFGNPDHVKLMTAFRRAEKLDPNGIFDYAFSDEWYDIPKSIGSCPYCHSGLEWSVIEYSPEDMTISEVWIVCKNLKNCMEDNEALHHAYPVNPSELQAVDAWIKYHYRIVG